jgi:hypothetical protein
VVDLKPIGEQSAVEAELIRQRQVNREEVAAVYGVPQPLAGILDHGTFANVTELHRIFYVTFLGAHLSLIAGSFQACLIEDEPVWENDAVFLEFNLGEILKGDTLQRYQAYALGVQNGILTLNDIRRMENQPPYPDPKADEPLISANNTRPLSQVGLDGGTADALGKPILDVIQQTVDDALARTVKAVKAGETALVAFDPRRVERELRARPHDQGMNGSSEHLAAGIANGLAEDLAEVRSLEQLEPLVAIYTGSTE